MIAPREYRHYPVRPASLTPDFIRGEYARLHAEIPGAEGAENADAWILLFRRWDSLKAYLSSEGSRLFFRYSGQMRDPELERAEKYMRETLIPVRQNGDSVFTRALLESKHRDALSREFGAQLINILETHVKPLDPRIAALRIEESRLSNLYSKILGNAEVDYAGERMTIQKIETFRTSSEAAVRRETFLINRKWFLEHRDELAAIYDDLVKVRARMAETLGDASFIPLGYSRMGRTDYGTAEAARFRKSVREEVVPVQTKLHAAQARALGTAKLAAWDLAYDPTLVLPMGIAPIDSQLERAQRVFDRMSPRLSHHFSTMREGELIDLENRPGKGAGAFCTSFTDEGRSAILCNSTGDAADVGTLMHEMGHAFQKMESMSDDRAIDLTYPTADAAEVHSMGMEYLSLSRLDEFFSAGDTEKFRRDRWKQSIELICYVAIVDEFQHWVYENPTASWGARDDEWTRLTGIYQPSVDYGEYASLISMRWYKQGHIFKMPFYYIDYAIAETGAMQLALLDAKDPDRAISVYLDLCKIGGSLSVLKVFESAGLESPFSQENMKRLMEYAAEQV